MKTKAFTAMTLLITFLIASIPVTSYCLSWEKNLDGGLAKAKSEGKPVMIDFYTDWCGWCKKLDADTYSNQRVQDLARSFICLKVNGDKFPNLVSKYLIEGYPTIVFLDPAGAEVARIVGYTDANGLSAKMGGIAAKYPGNTAEKAQPKETIASGLKNNITDLWNNAKEAVSKKEEAKQSAPASEEVARPKAEASPASEKAMVYSDIIILNNGNRLQGLIKEEKSDSYVVKVSFGEVTLKKSDVKEIKRLPPEEACLNMGNKLLESRNFDAAISEYNKALKINPGYLPAKDAIAAAKKKQLEYETRLKTAFEEEEKAKEEEKLAETSTVNEPPGPKRIPYFVSLKDMNIPLKKSYSLSDFGFTVDGNLVINSFVRPEASTIKSIVSSPAEYAGIRLGDKIISVNGKSVAGLSPVDVEKIIGSLRYIKLVVERQ